MTDSSTERLGRYQLLEPIGGGPNGGVWRANVFGVAGFERQFAIKRFLPELTASPSMAQALSAAARSYGSLEHPRIGRMSEFGVAQGQTFTAVELVAGLDAMRLVAESKLGGNGLPPGGSLALISQVARAVGYAHGRGLSHLGLSPSNVIVTADGDVKVTDFGILASMMTAHPVDTPRLASRIGYLAPEQLVGEATSAATDVYVLGVIAYELVTGQRAFFGDSAQAIASAILAGPPADPPLPRPIVRVLTRCLARSQFERFPDARAFADALDAALRVAPVPGTRKDIGAQVKATLDRHAALNEGNLSGLVALNMFAPAPPPRTRDSDEGSSTNQFVRPDVPVARPSPLVGPRDVSPATTIPEMHKPMTTVPGLVVPPPIPVPQGIGSSQPAPPSIPPVGSPTILGMSAAKRPIPGIVKPERVATGPVPLVRGTALKSSMEIPRIAPRAPLAPTSPPPALTPSGIGPPTDREAALDPSVPDETATAPFPVVEDPHEAPTLDGSLKGFYEPPPRPLEPTETSPSIQVIRGSDPDLPEHRPEAITSPPYDRDLPTGQMPAMLVRDLKLATADHPYINDPLVELAVEAHGGAIATPPTPPPTPPRTPTMPARTPTPVPRLRPTTPPARTPTPLPRAAPRMPSPSPPSLVPTRTPPRAVAEEPAVRAVPIARPPSEPMPIQMAPAPVAMMPPPMPQGGLAAPTAPQQTTTPGFAPAPAGSRAPTFTLPSQHGARKRWPMIAVIATVVVAGGGVAAWQLTKSSDGGGSGSVHVPTGSGSVQVTTGSGSAVALGSAHTGSATITPIGSAAGSATGSAGSATAIATGSAGSATATATATATGSAGSAATSKPTGTPTTDALAIASAPPGARVFIDGADQGITPVKLPGSSDRHTMALLLAGHDLYVAEVDGHGSFSVPLTSITPSGGPAGIKVIKCKDKERYYVFVDGKPTGMTCPTERIECTTGPHTVEVYDVVTENRRKWDITVTDTRLSYRVRIE